MNELTLPLDRFKKFALTKVLARQAGHIAWIESDDPVTAIRSMAASVDGNHNNCAVWANAGDYQKEFRDEIQKWRKQYHYKFTGKICDTHTTGAIIPFLTTEFNAAANKPSKQLDCTGGRLHDFSSGINALRDFTIQRTLHVQEALNPEFLIVRPRVNFTERARNTSHLHTERNKEGMRYRLIDAIYSPHTFIVDNSDVIFGEDGNFDVIEGPIAIYECPSNSLLMITRSDGKNTPAVHSEHFYLSPAENLESRSILTCDVGF